MDKPKITLDGKTYEMKEPKSKVWRLITELDENKKDIPNVELIEKFTEVLAQLFDIPQNELLEKMDISDVLPTFYACYRYIANVLFVGTKKLDSTQGGDEITTE